MSEWKEYKLGDLTDLVTKGTTPSSLGGNFVDKGINFIKSEAVGKDGRIDKSTFVCIDEAMHQKLKRSQLAKDDILFSMAGIYLGKNALVTEDILPANTNQALAIIRLNQTKANPKYIHYYLSQRSVIDFVNNMSGQSAQPNINFEEIKSIDVLLPDSKEQKSIAETLSSLDDKIDLLHRQNKTLEQLAETLFRQWFVEEAEESWELIKLDNYLELIIDHRGKTPTKLGHDWSFAGIPAISAKNIKNGKMIRPETFKYVDDVLYKKWMKVELQKGDIILTSEAPLGEVYLFNSNEKFVLSQRLFGLRVKKEFCPYFLFCLLRSPEGQHLLNSRASGSTVEGIKQSELQDVEILMPPIKILKHFNNSANEIFNKIENNDNQIRTLTQLRDTLLPKLMNGEVRVKN